MIAYEVHGRGPIKALALHGLFCGGQSSRRRWRGSIPINGAS